MSKTTSIGMVKIVIVLVFYWGICYFCGSDYIGEAMAQDSQSNVKDEINKDTVWKQKKLGEIVDVDPIVFEQTIGLFFEMNGDFVWVYIDNFYGDWPSRGSYGSFYTTKLSEKTMYKWENYDCTMNSKQTIPRLETTQTQSWTSALTTLPQEGVTVLVKYENGKTITTAYINNKKEWKLETEREKFSGGRKITVIAEWKGLQE